MNCVKKYKEYLKDNPEGYWFKRKLYGWGWTPAKWQGVAVILAFVAFVVWNGIELGKVAEPSESQATYFAIKVVISIILLLTVCYLKGEKPRWQWGLPDKK